MKSLAVATAILVAGSSLAYAQQSSSRSGGGESLYFERFRNLTPSDMQALTDARISLLKSALQLTPEEQRLWPPVEDAIRQRAALRQARMAKIESTISQIREGDSISGGDPTEIIRDRADSLIQRGQSLKKLADAWQPLYNSLDQDQKRRLKFLATRVLNLVGDAAEERRNMLMEEETD
jgi:hypothetical protein